MTVSKMDRKQELTAVDRIAFLVLRIVPCKKLTLMTSMLLMVFGMMVVLIVAEALVMRNMLSVEWVLQ